MYKVLFALVLIFAMHHSTQDNQQASLPQYDQLTQHQKAEVDCLTRNMYREAGIEKESGMIAVGLVTMNRVKTRGFPETVCKVVNQKNNKVCQFSWTCAKNLPSINKRIYSYSRSLAMKVFFKHDEMSDTTFGALFYHADYVKPGWVKLEVTTKIGRHIFYKPIGEA